MNSNTTDRRARGPRRSTRGPARRGRPTPAPRTSTHQAPALEPTLCDTAPIAFSSLNLDPRLLEGVRDLGFSETRAIQSAVIPLALAGSDLIACAETGSGKTCAFVLPTLQRLLAAGPQIAPSKSRVLVLAPTRELAVQIEDEIHGLAYHTTVTSAAVYGGVEMGGQERALRAGDDCRRVRVVYRLCWNSNSLWLACPEGDDAADRVVG